MLYSIGGKYHGKAYNCDKKIKLAMVKHINVGLFSFSGDITSFWHYVYPFQFNYITIDVSGLNVIFITDSTSVVNNHIHHTFTIIH